MTLLTYKKFNDRESAEALGEILKTKGIEFEITEDRNNIGSVYGNRTFTQLFYVNIRPEFFSKADEAVLKVSDESVATVDQDHYLYSFTDEELFDIVTKPDEWNALDYQLSQKILKERGKDISTETVALLKAQRTKELARPEPRQPGLIAAGYIFALVGGIIGVFIGWHISTYKKVLPDGKQVFGFQQEDRKQGRIIWILGSIMFIISLAIRFLGISE
ncbi:hypothetical protein BH10BAC4_BH10BAC4_04350 [soil metagenome]